MRRRRNNHEPSQNENRVGDAYLEPRYRVPPWVRILLCQALHCPLRAHVCERPEPEPLEFLPKGSGLFVADTPSRLVDEAEAYVRSTPYPKGFALLTTPTP